MKRSPPLRRTSQLSRSKPQRRKRRRARPGKDFRRYLAWVRTLPCRSCEAPPPSHAHHMRKSTGTGMKASDLDTLPLCAECHRGLHERLGHWGGMTRLGLIGWQELQIELVRGIAPPGLLQ